MGNRLSKIYTRTGDAGETGLGDGSRVGKDSARVCAYGTVDELNSAIGLLRCEAGPAVCTHSLAEVQHHLFDLGSELCVPGYSVLEAEHVTWLESVLDHLNASLPPLKEFILPGGSRSAALCHVARTQCRRAER
ncbi:MAG: cob(I)yrinic acid a,c-diamide adenosyltransferase, partial [Pseudomonadota bacterium]